MSLAIQADQVTSVLLTDGWHRVADKSFTLDSYEYMEDDTDDSYVLLPGGQSDLVCATGFRFLEDVDENAGDAYTGYRVRICGPLTSILAVQEDH